MLVFFRNPVRCDLSKAYIHGHYRRLPSGKRIWIDSHEDKRPERHRASFENTVHRVTHFQHHLAHGRQREALHAFHDLDGDASHALARHLGLLQAGEKHADKKTLMGAIHERIRAKQKLLERRGPYDKEADAAFAAREKRKDDAGQDARQSSIQDVVAVATRPGRDGNKAYHVYRKVSSEEAERAKRDGGLSIAGYEHGIDEAAVRHILAQHGDAKKEARRGQVAVTGADFLRLPDIANAAKADRVEYGKYQDGTPFVRYSKRDNGTMIVVEEVRTGRKRLALKTLWKTRAAPDAPALKPSPAQTPKTFGARPSQGEKSLAQGSPASNGAKPPRMDDTAPDAPMPRRRYRDPTRVNWFTPYEVGDFVRLPDGDWEIGQGDSGWHLKKPGSKGYLTDNQHPGARSADIGHDQMRLIQMIDRLAQPALKPSPAQTPKTFGARPSQGEKNLAQGSPAKSEGQYVPKTDRRMESHIKVAADSVHKLRKPDVARALDNGAEFGTRRLKTLAKYIASHRPDLRDEIMDVLRDDYHIRSL